VSYWVSLRPGELLKGGLGEAQATAIVAFQLFRVLAF